LLGVSLFIAFWVLLALVVFFVAGVGRRSAKTAAPRRRSGVMSLALIVIYVGFGVALPALFLHGNDANANKQVGGVQLTAAEKQGRELFAFKCGFCHTLAGANAVGKVGPNLDTIKPSKSLVLHTIANGCLPNASGSTSNQGCLGYGVMPSDILQGQEADEVASFVAAVAGKE
jgi:mono/diheme cytochrome c family protein